MLTTRDLAKRYGVTQQTVRRWCEKGYLVGAQRIGQGFRSTWIIPPAALEGFERPAPGRPVPSD